MPVMGNHGSERKLSEERDGGFRPQNSNQGDKNRVRLCVDFADFLPSINWDNLSIRLIYGKTTDSTHLVNPHLNNGRRLLVGKKGTTGVN
ncbi:hypothetical protein C0J52_11922 [Blattella germanica]|nr:hypothetical protein C0J52_11922 [Blattella germanica]